jgi:hypothetical protein
MRISKIEKETKYWSVQKNFYFASLRVIRRGETAGEEIPFFWRAALLSNPAEV